MEQKHITMQNYRIIQRNLELLPLQLFYNNLLEIEG